MSDILQADEGVSGPPGQHRDAVCRRFAAAWGEAGPAGRPRIEDFLGEVRGPEREALLHELIALDVGYRRSRGEAPGPADYGARFPGLDPGWLAGVAAGTEPGNGPAAMGEGRPVPNLAATGPYAPPPAGERFAPGEVVAGRYRIVELLGRGGMGEVYHAQDLTLGQPVALKFLPPGLAGDFDRLARLHQEVAAARRVSHPNVCRVYDIVEQKGLSFLTMEYVKGEDLASLLRQVGRWPEESAVEIARQLCAALAAVHDQGLLHRDLKPANVLIDHRGKVRLADFGLAVAAGRLSASDVRAGTPAYQAPEQLRGEAAGVPSDLFALGLVLYEVFTGRRAFPADSRKELLRQYGSGPPSKPTSLVPGLSPAAEQAVLRCLEPDARARPRSAYEVLAALPGRDLLQEALEAGQTPSPGRVAAGGGQGGLSPAVGGACLAAVVAGLLVSVFLLQGAKLIARVPLPLPPEVLRHEAEGVLRQLGQGEPGDWAFGFDHDSNYLRWVEENDPSPRRWDALGNSQPAALYFWYREGPDPLVPGPYYPSPGSLEVGRISWQDPPPVRPGMAAVKLDLTGRLIEYQAVPPEKEEPGEENSTPQPDWDPLFRAAGFGRDNLTPAAAPARPLPVYADRRAAWEGPLPDRPDVRVTVEAAAYRGRPVFFQIVAPWTRRDEAGDRASVATGPRDTGFAVLFALLLGGAAVLAPWNLGRGRADPRGAFRVALFVFAMFLLVWLFEARHVWGPEEVRLLVLGGACALYWAGLCWLSYVALEPFARRLWPETLISWSRLLMGRAGDPRVGRDLLIGTLAGVGWSVLFALARLAPEWMGQRAPTPYWDWWVPTTFLSGYWVGNLLDNFPYAIRNGLFFWLLLLILFRAVFRKPWLAAGLYVATLTALTGPLDGLPAASCVFVACAQALGVVVLVRCGVLATIAMIFVAYTLDFPIASRLSAWYAREGLVDLGLVLALAAYGFWTSLGSRPAAPGPGGGACNN